MHKPLPDDTTQARWLVGSNADSSEIPAYSLVKVTATDTQGRFDVAEPDAADNVIYIVGDLAIPAADADGDGVGAITGDWPAWAAYDAADGAPAIGETWGHEAGTFKLKKDAPGFRIVSDPDEDQEIVRVERASGGESCCTFGTDWQTFSRNADATTYALPNVSPGSQQFFEVPKSRIAIDTPGRYRISGGLAVAFDQGTAPTEFHVKILVQLLQGYDPDFPYGSYEVRSGVPALRGNQNSSNSGYSQINQYGDFYVGSSYGQWLGRSPSIDATFDVDATYKYFAWGVAVYRYWDTGEMNPWDTAEATAILSPHYGSRLLFDKVCCETAPEEPE